MNSAAISFTASSVSASRSIRSKSATVRSELCRIVSLASLNASVLISLPAGMHLTEKCSLLREQFPDVNHCPFYFRVRKWSGIKGKKEHPDRPEVYRFFTTLPHTIPLPKNRILFHKEFPDISRKLLNRWLNAWSGTKTRIRHPDYSDVNGLFLSFPLDMHLSEKRRLIYEQFPNVKQDPLRKWTREWQSALDL